MPVVSEPFGGKLGHSLRQVHGIETDSFFLKTWDTLLARRGLARKRRRTCQFSGAPSAIGNPLSV